MLGVVGDLDKDRVIAWEITPDLDTTCFEKEVRFIKPFFAVSHSSLDTLHYSVGCISDSVCVGNFIYVDVDSERLGSISKLEFFRRFKRSF